MLNQTNYYLLSISIVFGAILGSIIENVALGVLIGASVFTAIFFARRASALKKREENKSGK